MTKRYCDRCGQQIDEGVHAWYVLELHGTDGEFRHKELCEECYELLAEDNYIPRIEQTENSSEIPNNCEHITEDGVTCAKYPACDDCLDNPLNKAKGSERLVKGSEQTEPTISKMEQVEDEPQTETEIAKAIVHKMIDNSVIAEDAYPSLRQRMHEAVERLGEYYSSEDERSE